MKTKIIYGCDGRSDGHLPYLTRYTLIDRSNWQLCLHVFHRSDYPDFHDHPWNFLTLVLWRGYIEHFPDGKTRRVWPGMILFRPATHQHWVELVKGHHVCNHSFERPHLESYEKRAITLVFMGKRKREWGFWLKGKFLHWLDYFKVKNC